jgi:hypothetical protein
MAANPSPPDDWDEETRQRFWARLPSVVKWPVRTVDEEVALKLKVKFIGGAFQLDDPYRRLDN